MFLTSTMPLFFEMACEAAYPVPEGITNLVLTLSSNIGGLIFLVIQMIPNIGNICTHALHIITHTLLIFTQIDLRNFRSTVHLNFVFNYAF